MIYLILNALHHLDESFLKIISIHKVEGSYLSVTEESLNLLYVVSVATGGIGQSEDNYTETLPPSLPPCLPASLPPLRCDGGRASQLRAGCVLSVITWTRPAPDTSPPTLTVPNSIQETHLTFTFTSSSVMDSTRRFPFIREKETKVWEKKAPHENGSPSASLSPIFFHFPFRHLAVVTVRLSDYFVSHDNHNNLMIISTYLSSSLPCAAFLFCIIYSFFYHYEWVTRTHCQVWNIAPSISGK